MFSQSSVNQFPVWEFLNQPVFHPEVKLILNPNQFWVHHRISLLERCWALTSVNSNKSH
jgi:hypothetical protein